MMAGATMSTIIYSRAVFAVFATLTVGLAIAAIVFGPGLRHLWRSIWWPLTATLAVMFGAWLISSLQGIDLERSLLLLPQTIGTMVAAWLVYVALDIDEAGRIAALRSLILAMLVCSAVSIGAFTLSHELIDPFGVRGIKTDIHVGQKLRKFGAVVALLLPVAIWAALRLGGLWRLAAVPVVVLAAAVIDFTESRVGLLGLAAMLTVLLFVGLVVRFGRKFAIATAAGAVAMALAGATAIVARLPELPVQSVAGYRIPPYIIDYHRQVIWRFVIDKARDRPVLGYGVGNSRNIPGAKTADSVFASEYVPAHPHNWVIQLYAETGLVGLIAALIPLGLVFRRFGVAAAGGSGAAWAGLGLLGAGFGSWLVSFKVWAAWWQIELFFALAIVWACFPRNVKAAPH